MLCEKNFFDKMNRIHNIEFILLSHRNKCVTELMNQNTKYELRFSVFTVARRLCFLRFARFRRGPTQGLFMPKKSQRCG